MTDPQVAAQLLEAAKILQEAAAQLGGGTSGTQPLGMTTQAPQRSERVIRNAYIKANALRGWGEFREYPRNSDGSRIEGAKPTITLIQPDEYVWGYLEDIYVIEQWRKQLDKQTNTLTPRWVPKVHILLRVSAPDVTPVHCIRFETDLQNVFTKTFCRLVWKMPEADLRDLIIMRGHAGSEDVDSILFADLYNSRQEQIFAKKDEVEADGLVTSEALADFAIAKIRSAINSDRSDGLASNPIRIGGSDDDSEDDGEHEQSPRKSAQATSTRPAPAAPARQPDPEPEQISLINPLENVQLTQMQQLQGALRTANDLDYLQTLDAWIDSSVAPAVQNPPLVQGMHAEVEKKRRQIQEMHKRIDSSDVLARIEVEIRRLNLAPAQGRVELQKLFGERFRSRSQLNPEQLEQFAAHLATLTPAPTQT